MDTFPENITKTLRAGITTASAAETEGLGVRLAHVVPDDTWVALRGDLGAGKTTFARGFARGMGIKEDITSPTFAIFVPYTGTSRQLVHMDAYRLNGPDDLDSLMLDDCLRPPYILLLEWPERLRDTLPHDTWHITFRSIGEARRNIRLQTPPSATL
ncbi:MAG: tRNA (adenosine(37)-N6)-threonylcarbamoyltransferase complex ATPase subunit type 1 TsaE [Opitutales bacterium]|nr:tRNA (adenosine(37)-N6)-threonylcarbamoyltransferase complex ATPase subunit type 1 TsaE [Opitutales bacterium]